MIRYALIFLLIALMAAGLAWLADQPGSVRIDLAGTRIGVPPVLFTLVILLLCGLAALIYRCWRWLRRGHGERVRLAQHQRGQHVLTRGLNALMAGETARAGTHGRMLEKLTGSGPLSDFLTAQAALQAGQLAQARAVFQKLADREDADALGARGLIAVAEQAGDFETAHRLAAAAAMHFPAAPWVHRRLFASALRRRDWDSALTALEGGQRRGDVTADEAARDRSTLYLAQAQEALARDDKEAALARAKQALRADEGLVPASVLAGDLLRLLGRPFRGRRLLQEGWAAFPHPDFAAVWLAYYPGATAPEAYKKLQKLVRKRPDVPEAQLLLADAALKAHLPGVVRGYLDTMGEGLRDRRWYVLRAGAEEEMEQPEQAAAIRAEAEAAPSAPLWVCRACGHSQREWAAACPPCETFAAFDWRVPQAAPLAAPQNLLGAPETPEPLQL